MKLSFYTLLAVLGALCARGQEMSRVILLRIENNVGGAASSSVLHNGIPIGDLPVGWAIVYDIEDATGVYMLANDEGSDTYRNAVTIKPGKNSLTIIKLRAQYSAQLPAPAELMSVSELEQLYNADKQIRKRFTTIGYKTFTELTAGFVAKDKSVGVPNPKTPATMVPGQADTFYLDEDRVYTYRENAATLSIIRCESKKYYSVEKYSLETGTLLSKGHVTEVDSMTKTGVWQEYYDNGRLQSKTIYEDGWARGRAENYYDTTNSPLHYVYDNKPDLSAELTSYYLSGRIKRQEFHKKVPLLVPGREPDTRDSVYNSKCYKENGEERDYTPFQVPPKPAYNLGTFLGQNLKYPERARENNIEGRVILKFVVDTNGKVTQPRVWRHVSPDLDREAKRVVSLLPPWTPGMLDDELVDVYFNLPIVFKLE